MRPEAMAPATKSFSTRSRRSRSLQPHAVANRRQVTAKPSSASASRSCSDMTFDLAYAVSGPSSEPSERIPSSAEPYTLQLEANTKARAPASRASRATSTVLRWLIA